MPETMDYGEPTIKCERCGRTQFDRTGKTHCQACGKRLRPVEVVQPPAIEWSPPQNSGPARDTGLQGEVQYWALTRLVQVRKLKGISERSVALSIGCLRTWVSKVENQRKPRLSTRPEGIRAENTGGERLIYMDSLLRLCRGVGVPIAVLLDESLSVRELAQSTGGWGGRDEDVTLELAELLPQMSRDQRRAVLRAARAMRKRRHAPAVPAQSPFYG
jgi:hypothetical protein